MKRILFDALGGFFIFLALVGVIATTSKPFDFFSLILIWVFLSLGVFFLKDEVVNALKNAKTKKQQIERILVFPEQDDSGHKKLNLMSMRLSGVTFEHFGCNPQKVIPKLLPGERLVLTPESTNKHDKTAVSVKTLDNEFIGWIPSGRNSDIFKRIIEGQTVLARVKEKGTFIKDDREFEEDFEDDEENEGTDYFVEKTWYCEIEVAKYSKNLEKAK